LRDFRIIQRRHSFPSSLNLDGKAFPLLTEISDDGLRLLDFLTLHLEFKRSGADAFGILRHEINIFLQDLFLPFQDGLLLVQLADMVPHFFSQLEPEDRGNLLPALGAEFDMGLFRLSQFLDPLTLELLGAGGAWQESLIFLGRFFLDLYHFHEGRLDQRISFEFNLNQRFRDGQFLRSAGLALLDQHFDLDLP
jgi:hypothetical protein